MKDVDTHSVLLAENAKEERAIGLAFASLLAGLPEKLQDLTLLFAHCHEIPYYQQKNLVQEDNVQAAHRFYPPTLALVGYHLTPLRVLIATQAPVGLASRYMDNGNQMKPSSEFYLAAPEFNGSLPSDDVPLLPVHDVVREILQCTNCGREDVVSILLSWLIEVSKGRPYLFYGGKATPCKNAQQIVKITIDENAKGINLQTRWLTEPDDCR